MRSLARIVVVFALLASLAGCFMSREPLIGPDEASFPFERIMFRLDGESDGEQMLTREGDHYRMTDQKDPEHSILFRFRDVGDGAYVAQLWPPPEEQAEEAFLYAVMLDRGETILVHGAMKPRDFTALPGLRLCDGEVCIDDLDAYADYVKQRIAAGAKPDLVHRVLERE